MPARGSRRTSKQKCGATSAISFSTPPFRGRCGSRKRRVTGCPQSRTTVARVEPMRTGRWRWSLSNAPERKGLGRGLEVLLGGAAPAELVELPVAAIHPNPRQPRKRFDSDGANGLAESVRAQGVVQPVLVRSRAAGGYELIAGERRWRAAREAGLKTVPAVVRDADDLETLLLGLVENVARENLSPVEEARAYAVLLDEFALGLGEVAEKVGKGMSVRAAERAARWAGARTKPRRQPARLDPALVERAKAAADRLTGFSSRVTRGRLEIPFADETELAELVEALEEAAPK